MSVYDIKNLRTYDKICKLMLQGWDIDTAIEQGMFEGDEISEVYDILDRAAWSKIDEYTDNGLMEVA